jgi:hypothetical protein
MAADSTITTLGVADAGERERVMLAVMKNPFRGSLGLRLDLERPMAVSLEVLDARGRRVAERRHGWLGAGSHRLTWDGKDARGADAGAGFFWVRVRAGEVSLVRDVVRLR